MTVNTVNTQAVVSVPGWNTLHILPHTDREGNAALTPRQGQMKLLIWSFPGNKTATPTVTVSSAFEEYTKLSG